MQQGGPEGPPRDAWCDLRAGHDIDDATSAVRSELDGAGCESEQGVVLASAHVVAWVEVGATLAHDDLAGVDQLATEALHAKALGIGVAAVTGTGNALFGCHVVTSPQRCR